ncbi:MAG TPA: MerR family transcriptional regulator [Ktedonobacteraceae bacterium]|jgi:DNA-binding transcriptional MerR regulator|nr:MerR family transcriptional regulator [Ktedonobacteraceae bacterium]
MLKIRDFARLADISMVTLRHYDEIGLFKPSRVDPETGYRFYTLDQLPQLHRILALKDLGLGLAQIVQILVEGLSPEALQGMLRLKQAELQQRIQTEQEQFSRVAARLQYLEQGGCMPPYEVVLKTIRPTTAVSLCLTEADFAHKWQHANALLALLKQHGITSSDHLHFLYQESDDGNLQNELQIAVPVEPEDAISLVEKCGGRVALCELPAVARMASTLHRGNPYTIFEALQVLGTWIETNHYSILDGPRRVVCLRKDGDMNDYLSELQFPVEKLL